MLGEAGSQNCFNMIKNQNEDMTVVEKKNPVKIKTGTGLNPLLIAALGKKSADPLGSKKIQ